MARRVYTQRMQEVLEPVAQSISILISRIEESEQDGVVLSDLTGPSAAVLAACKGLSNAGRSLCDGADPILDKAMPPSADSLDASATHLHEAAMLLKSDPRDKAAKEKLMGGARGILDGTTAVLEVFDDQIVRRIVEAANGLIDSVKKLQATNDLAGLVAAVKQYNTVALNLARRTDARCKELAEDQYRNEVLAANENIRRSCPTLIAAHKAKITCPGDSDAGKPAETIGQQIVRAAERIRYLVQLKFYREADLYSDPAVASILNPANAAFKMLAQAMVGQLIDSDQLEQNLKPFFDGCEKIARLCRDPSEQKDLLDSIAKAKQSLAGLKKAAAAYEGNPSDPEAKAAYELAAQELNEEVAALHNHALRVLAAEKERALAQNHVTAGELRSCAAAGDAAGVAANAKALIDDAKALAMISEAALPFVSDAGKARAVQVAVQAVQDGAPVFCSAAKAAAQNKDDAGAQELASLIHQDYKDRIDRLGQAMDSALPATEWSASANEQAVLAAIPAVKTAADSQDMPKYSTNMASIAERVKRMMKLCEGEAENASDKELAAALWMSAKDLQKAAAQYKDAANAYSKCPADDKLRVALATKGAALGAAVTGTRKALGGESIQEIHAREKAAELARQQRRDEAKRRKEEEARNAELKRQREQEEKKRREADEKARLAELERLAAENAIKLVEAEEKLKFKDNEIGHAAQELHEEANQWDESENSVVSLARQIAQMFNRMAEINEDASRKRELIELAKQIAEAAKNTSKLAVKFANNCADTRLKRDLLTTVSQIDTISAQLKIIAAVKAANYMDDEADEQLTCCAQNLMAAVQACVGQCHSASIKPVNKDDPILKTIQWRKKVFRGRADAKW